MTGRTWFITGLGSGLGRHLTEQLLARGGRLALGSDAFENMRHALAERLAALQAEEEIARSTDFATA